MKRYAGYLGLALEYLLYLALAYGVVLALVAET